MTPPPIADPPALIDEQVKRDLCATVRLNLMMVGVWLADGQLTALVEAVVARLDAEWRVRQLRPPPPKAP